MLPFQVSRIQIIRPQGAFRLLGQFHLNDWRRLARLFKNPLAGPDTTSGNQYTMQNVYNMTGVFFLQVHPGRPKFEGILIFIHKLRVGSITEPRAPISFFLTSSDGVKYAWLGLRFLSPDPSK